MHLSYKFIHQLDSSTQVFHKMDDQNVLQYSQIQIIFYIIDFCELITENYREEVFLHLAHFPNNNNIFIHTL